jgi:hypothetical protein
VRQEETRLSLAREDGEVVLPEVDHDLLELALAHHRTRHLCGLEIGDCPLQPACGASKLGIGRHGLAASFSA